MASRVAIRLVITLIALHCLTGVSVRAGLQLLSRLYNFSIICLLQDST